MTDITELAQRMKAAAEKATQGEWWSDEVKNEGCYGSGDDCVEGFTSYAIYGYDGQTLFDSLNSDAACISEEYDGEGHVAWDETAQRNAEFIALANPANILALVEALEKAQSANEYLREQSAEWERKAISNFEDCAEMSARIEELESQRKLAFAASNRWADKFREAEQRIAELESRTVTAAAAAVLAERKRQVAAEGWTSGHDDEYEHGELADAAGCYALSSELFDCAGEPPRPWPWPDEWWKPTNRRRDLVKAGALILAEIERLDRASGIKVEAE
ncbi:ead/Ea22-like family protein [Klebsiella variicola]|uniref:ead/Ea22-like family protein n=1 Tax=Klebsiella variicola TaxID=244366 RepID=UPI0016232B36|nr:ead/Ea22-like family protein [Klebsiella variicola]